MLDARVRVRGVVLPKFQGKWQRGATLHVALPGNIERLAPRRAEPFDRPLSPLESVMEFRPGGRPAERVRVRGEVTLNEPEFGAFLQEGGYGIRIQGRGIARLRPGDRIEAAGYEAVTEGDHPTLRDVLIRPVSSPAAAWAQPVSLAALWKENHEGRLVRVSGTVRQFERGSAWCSVLLEDNGAIVWLKLRSAQVKAPLLPGSRIQATGVCHVDRSPLRSMPSDVRVISRHAGEWVLLEPAPWVDRIRWSYWAGAIAAVALVAAGWVFLLRRQVARQTQELVLA
jgi:hypothetical protein